MITLKNIIELPNGLPKDTKAVLVHVFLGSAKMGTEVRFAGQKHPDAMKVCYIKRLFPSLPSTCEDTRCMIQVTEGKLYWDCSDPNLLPKFELVGYYVAGDAEFKSLFLHTQ